MLVTFFQDIFLNTDNSYIHSREPACNENLYLAIKSHGYGFGIGLIFFGFECLVPGYLILRSGFLPWILGVLMQVAGLCYLANSFALLLAPTFADKLFPAIMVPPFIAEASLCLWLIVKGVNVLKWKKQVSMEPVRGMSTEI